MRDERPWHQFVIAHACFDCVEHPKLVATHIPKEGVHSFLDEGKERHADPACATNHRLNVTDRITRQHVWERALRRVAVDNGGIIARQREKREEWRYIAHGKSSVLIFISFKKNGLSAFFCSYALHSSVCGNDGSVLHTPKVQGVEYLP